MATFLLKLPHIRKYLLLLYVPISYIRRFFSYNSYIFSLVHSIFSLFLNYLCFGEGYDHYRGNLKFSMMFCAKSSWILTRKLWGGELIKKAPRQAFSFSCTKIQKNIRSTFLKSKRQGQCGSLNRIQPSAMFCVFSPLSDLYLNFVSSRIFSFDQIEIFKYVKKMHTDTVDSYFNARN